MAQFSELIKSFDKIRDYMRDFYVYGFKSRDEFTKKSLRTYDNEKRRCESYLNGNMKWTYSGGSKISFVSFDCSRAALNPFFAAWKSKSFTANDIMLHFYILDALREGEKSAETLTGEVSLRSGKTFDMQTVRNKCREYTEHSILSCRKTGKAFRYSLASDGIEMSEQLLDAVKFFQGGNLGVAGSYILDNAEADNDLFVFKHHYIAYTLEDGIAAVLLEAIHANRIIDVSICGSKSGDTVKNSVLPLKILVSARTGRRYLCAYTYSKRRFTTYRLDSIKSVEQGKVPEDAAEIKESLERNINKVWGVSFDGAARIERFSMKLRIDEENEKHIISRLRQESRGGELCRIDKDIFVYSAEIFDVNEASPWIKTFVGRIISLESANSFLVNKFYSDMRRLAEMYCSDTEAESDE